LGRIFRLRTYVNLSRFIPNQTQMSKRTAASTTLTVKSSKKKATTSASTASAAGPGVAGSNVFSGSACASERFAGCRYAARAHSAGGESAHHPRRRSRPETRDLLDVARSASQRQLGLFARGSGGTRAPLGAASSRSVWRPRFPTPRAAPTISCCAVCTRLLRTAARSGRALSFAARRRRRRAPASGRRSSARSSSCATFSPLRIARKWRHDIYMALKAPKTVAFEEVDAHNIVPCWRASDKQEWAARTLRIKYAKGLLSRLPLRVPQARRRPCRRRAAPARRRPPPHRRSTGPKSLAGCRPTTRSRQWRGWCRASAPPTPRWRSSARRRASRST
jgi:hypothetical protein